MGKLLDFALSDTWEEYQRIQLYKAVEAKLNKKKKKKKKDTEDIIEEKIKGLFK